MTQKVINILNNGGGGGSNKTEYGGMLEFRNCTRENFGWDTEDDLNWPTRARMWKPP